MRLKFLGERWRSRRSIGINTPLVSLRDFDFIEGAVGILPKIDTWVSVGSGCCDHRSLLGNDMMYEWISILLEFRMSLFEKEVARNNADKHESCADKVWESPREVAEEAMLGEKIRIGFGWGGEEATERRTNDGANAPYKGHDRISFRLMCGICDELADHGLYHTYQMSTRSIVYVFYSYRYCH